MDSYPKDYDYLTDELGLIDPKMVQRGLEDLKAFAEAPEEPIGKFATSAAVAVLEGARYLPVLF